MIDSNVPASEFVGDPMDENPNQSTIRIYIQNLNGLCWNKDGGKWPYVCKTLETIQADIACFSELNTDTNRYDIRTKMEAVCRQHCDQNNLILSASTIKTPTYYKPGGTAILARNSITSRIKSHTRDRMGRWASISISTVASRKIRIISAYQVCRNAYPGSNTAAAHQTAQLIVEMSKENVVHRKDPRQAFIHDLRNFIKQIQNDGEQIILAGDFNEEITSHESGMNTLATSCGLVDVFSIRLGSATQPPTYQRGTKRLDYLLMSPSLLPMILAAGYDPFGYRLPSDHRGMYVDLSTDAIFEQELPEMSAASKREFRTSSPGVIQTYVSAKMKYLDDHQFFTRLAVLESSVTCNHELAEALDRDFQRAAYHAAKKCTRKPRAPWSPLLAQTWAELHYYRLLRSAAKTSVNYQPAISKIQSQWPELLQTTPTTEEAILVGQQQALAKLKQIRHNAGKLREEFLTRRYAQCTGEDDRQTAKIIQRIIRAESQHKVYCKIKYLRNQDCSTFGLSSLKIPKNTSPADTEAIKTLPDTEIYWETITIPEEIERLLVQRNQLHFSQAEGTPFTRPPFQVEVGYKADGFAADLILSGQIDYPNASTATSLLIKHLQKRTTTTLEGTITAEEVLHKLQNWKETTTTSPSGIHLGHYHCMWKDPHLSPDDPCRDIISNQQKMLLRVTVSLMNYALKFGYTYERWTKIVNVMLQKDPGNPRIHRLRVIHIYEADYNMLLAIKWRQALHHAEDSQLLNDGMYGSRPGRSAHDPALLEVLQHEIYRMS